MLENVFDVSGCQTRVMPNITTHQAQVGREPKN